MIIFEILLAVISIVVLGAFLLGIIITGKLMWKFYHHKCPYCGKNMHYRGTKDDKEKGNVYLFECPKCKAWDNVSITSFL